MAGLVFYFMIDRDRPEIFETGKAWSIFDLFNRNWAVCSLKLHVQYETSIRLYGSNQRQSLKRVFVFENSAWSSMI